MRKETDMPQLDEHKIAARSYSIWESEGKPDGKALDHWLQAQSELVAEIKRTTKAPIKAKAKTATAAKKPRAAAKPKKTIAKPKA